MARQSRKVSEFNLMFIRFCSNFYSFSRLDEARKVLQRIRGPLHNIEEELEAIKSSAEETERELGVI